MRKQNDSIKQAIDY